MAISSSLIIATYNWPQALDLCLNSVIKQRVLPDEVVIADDGSGPETAAMINKYADRLPIKHIWHADNGFRLAAIRNKANAAAGGEYLIQIDGDLILHPDFVGDHLRAAKKEHFIGGSRVILSQELTDSVFKESGKLPSLFSKGVRNRLNGMHSKILADLLSSLINTRKSNNIRGCNMSYWKKDFVDVNGYDEEFVGWGREDTDLVLRFYKAGLQRSFFKLRGIVYHLWHKEAERKDLDKNELILQQTKSGGRIRCEKGVDQYL